MKLNFFSKHSDEDEDFDDESLSDDEEKTSFFSSFFKKRGDDGAGDSGDDDDGDGDGDGDGGGGSDGDSDGDEDDEGGQKRGWLLIGGIFLAVGVVGATIGYFIVRDSDEIADIVAPPPPLSASDATASTTATLPMPPRLGPENRNEALLTPPGGSNPARRRSWLKDPNEQGGETASPSASPAPTASVPAPAPPSTSPPTPPSGGETEAVLATRTPAPSPSHSPAAASPRTEAAAGPAPGEGTSTPTPSFAALPVPPKSEPLLPVHAPALSSKGPYGSLPIITPQGKTAINTYARPFAGDTSKPRVAVIITGLGLNRERTEAAIDRLPADVTLAFSPYSADVKSWVDRARAAGHEALLELPMEPSGFPLQDPGPLALLTMLTPQENAIQLEKVLGKGGSFIGVLAIMGDRFLASSSQTLPILLSLQQRGLMYVDNGSVPGGGALASGAPAGLTFSVANLTIDEQLYASAIDARLATVAQGAKNTGRSIALASAYPITLTRLSAWIATLPAKGLELAPVSAVAVTAAPYK